ncbi:type III-B CRISPR module RAMP protein Cmr4 [Tepiditoga spiralis]|uniref:Type III-B CRISPR module RAMP protein Cmr4 n=1 Tax=Tepiditoga spiralis TaxID=2108365 RepID=A0A7G1G8K8_9BACT|nr:type III-B CRISPR module RAMP protein Cmr4 [Tepiditoga spiralis]BBE31756.1 type III-B CRISPR module RAMP protein Cmr4 [Tepiditoga spiralis]
MKGKVAFLYSVTQLHAGKGFDSGVVDLPIQREEATGFPIVSGIKGAIRNEIKWGSDEKDIFGAMPDNKNEDLAGTIAFSEAKIFLFPLRSISHGFVWVTCPMVLSRLKTAFKLTNNNKIEEKISTVLKNFKNEELSTFNSSQVNIEEFLVTPKYSKELKEFLEELKEITPDEYLSDKLINTTVLLSDKDFMFFVKNSTEVMARIKINKEKGVTEQGALWYEEYLPNDTVMYFIVKEILEKNTLEKLEEKLNDNFINVGGKATIGKGFAYIKVI